MVEYSVTWFLFIRSSGLDLQAQPILNQQKTFFEMTATGI